MALGFRAHIQRCTGVHGGIGSNDGGGVDKGIYVGRKGG